MQKHLVVPAVRIGEIPIGAVCSCDVLFLRSLFIAWPELQELVELEGIPRSE